MFRCARIASHASLPLAIAVLKLFFSVFTVLSASPLYCGWYGLVVVCRNIHDVEKVLNSSAVNCGPLSVTSSSGMP